MPSPSANNQNPALSELVHYFQIRSQALSDYSTRTWQRFNWFMTIHLGGFGLVLSNYVKSPQSDWFGLIAIVLAATALLWIALGYEDFQQLQRTTEECQHIEQQVTKGLNHQQTFTNFVGKPKKAILGFHHARIIYLFPVVIMVSWLLLAGYFHFLS